jgi:hypothetical protein
VSKFMKKESTFSTAPREEFSSGPRSIKPESGEGWTSFKRQHSYEAELASAPDVRSSAVERGRALIANPNYPSREQLNKIARVLVAAGLGR